MWALRSWVRGSKVWGVDHCLRCARDEQPLQGWNTGLGWVCEQGQVCLLPQTHTQRKVWSQQSFQSLPQPWGQGIGNPFCIPYVDLVMIGSWSRRTDHNLAPANSSHTFPSQWDLSWAATFIDILYTQQNHDRDFILCFTNFRRLSTNSG